VLRVPVTIRVSGTHPGFYQDQLRKAMAPMHYLAGGFDPLLASISPKICKIEFCNRSTSNLGSLNPEPIVFRVPVTIRVSGTSSSSSLISNLLKSEQLLTTHRAISTRDPAPLLIF